MFRTCASTSRACGWRRQTEVSRLVFGRLAPAERQQQLDQLADLYAEDTDVRHPLAPLGVLRRPGTGWWHRRVTRLQRPRRPRARCRSPRNPRRAARRSPSQLSLRPPAVSLAQLTERPGGLSPEISLTRTGRRVIVGGAAARYGLVAAGGIRWGQSPMIEAIGGFWSQGTWLPSPASRSSRTQPCAAVETLRNNVQVPPSPGV